MPLTSPNFAGNARLDAASRNSPAMHRGEGNAEAVRRLQGALVQVGFRMPRSTRPDGTFDGVYGGETVEVVQQFQLREGLVDAFGRGDGIAGKMTLERLDSQLNAPPSGTDQRSLALNTDLPLSQRWVARSLQVLLVFEQSLRGVRNLSQHDITLCNVALDVNFGFQRVQAAQRIQFVTRVRNGFGGLLPVFAAAASKFKNTTVAVATPIFAPDPAPPAFAFFQGEVHFTELYKPFEQSTGEGFGPNCRAAMVTHECVHVFDRASADDESIHISEFDEPAFSNQSLFQKLHNPSAYASFAGQVFSDTLLWPTRRRFGAGNPSV